MNIHDTVRTLMRDGKGILAVDQDASTLQKYFSAFNIQNTEDSRQKYFELLFGTSGIEKLLSAIILPEERIKQCTESGVPFSDLISSKNILVGVHIDENISENISARLQEYKSLAITCAKKPPVWKLRVLQRLKSFVHVYKVSSIFQWCAKKKVLFQFLD